MSLHWAHVLASYALVVGAFLIVSILTLARLRAAKRELARLDPRARRDA